MLQIRRTAPAALLAAGLLAGCDRLGTEPIVLHHVLADDTKELLAEYPAAQAKIEGALEMLFGTPSAPAFMVTDEWFEAEYDPNSPVAMGELSEAELGRVVAGNRDTRFRTQLAHLDAGEYDQVRIPAWMPDLAANWAFYVDENAQGKSGDSFAADMRGMLENWYPSLRESAELYRRQCFHCHGVSGGADGTTAPWLNPLPRNYRKGTYKFTALAGDGFRPRRQDLYRIIEEGVYGTAMPSFRRFTPAEINGLVDYVRLLSMRGEVETGLAITYTDNDPPALPIAAVKGEYETVWAKWKDGEAKDALVVVFDGDVPRPNDPYPDDSGMTYLARGHALYTEVTEQGQAVIDCATCHGMSGRGDGLSSYEDVTIEDEVTGEDIKVTRLKKDEWGHPIAARDFSRGVFRFGRRPIDIYRRIYAGIKGTPMPAHDNLEPEKIWALVHYVRSLASFEETRAL